MAKDMKDKAIGSATVGTKGQIVIPQKIRKMFDIKPGDTLIVLADKNKGIAILKSELVEQLAEKGVVNE